VVPGANYQVTPHYLEGKADVLRSAAIVLTQLEIPLESVEWLARFCAESGVPLMLDPAPAAALPDSLLGNVAWFTPNETEAAYYAGDAGEADQLPQRLFALGTRNVILKRSTAGALVISADGSSIWTDAFPVQAVDSTAAGDAFNAAFAVALARGLTLQDSARFAAAAAAVSVTREGAQASLPTSVEVASLMG
jgi:ribokinase